VFSKPLLWVCGAGVLIVAAEFVEPIGVVHFSLMSLMAAVLFECTFIVRVLWDA